MANKKIVFEGNGGLTLVAALDWQLLPASKKLDAAVREKARIKSATHFVACRAQASEEVQVGKKPKQVHRVTAGLIQSLGKADSFGKKPHSAAAAFAAWTKEYPKAALFGALEDDRVVVVVTINGMPVLDVIAPDRTEARMRLAAFLQEHVDMAVFANDSEQYPNDFYDELWQSIAGSVSGATQIKPIPVDYVKLAVIAVVGAAVLGGWQYWNIVQAKKEQAALAEEAAKNSPDTLYLNALSALPGFGIERNALLQAFDAIQPLPAKVNGWTTSEVTCTADGCSIMADRVHGTFDLLRSGIAHLPLTIQPNQAEINLGRVKATWDQAIRHAPYPEAARTATVNTFVSNDGSQFQDWMLAGLSLRIEAPQLYPEVQGVSPTFQHPQAVRRGAFEVGGISLPLVREVIQTAPPNIVFTGYKVTLSPDGDDPLSKATTTVTGFYYVNQ